MESLSALACDPRQRSGPSPAIRRGEFRFLRQKAVRNQGDTAALEALRAVHRSEPGRSSGTSVLLNVHLFQSFAQVQIGGLHATLPARQYLLGSGQLSVVEIEILLDESLGKGRSAVVDHMPAQINFTFRQ